MRRNLAIEIFSFLLVMLFMYAAVSKLIDVEKFSVQISQSPLLTIVRPIVPWGIPAVEILLSIMLMTPFLRLVGLYGAFTLMVMFTAYIIAILTISPTIPCSCGGVLQTMGWGAHLAFNLVFTLMALSGIVLFEKERDGQSDRKQTKASMH